MVAVLPRRALPARVARPASSFPPAPAPSSEAAGGAVGGAGLAVTAFAGTVWSLSAWHQRLAGQVARHQDALCEWAVGCLVVAGLGWGGLAGWRFYGTTLRPYARAAPIVAALRFAHLSDPDQVRRMQRATDLLGEATAYLQAKRWEWARAKTEEALALDPDYAEAKVLLHRLSTEPPPALTLQEQAVRARDDRVVELLGAASSYEEAGRADLARPRLEQALALDPDNAVVRDALDQLDDS